MATIMERDVLIEAVAFTRGTLWRQTEKVRDTDEYRADDNLMSKLRDKYLYSEAKDLNWEEEVDLMKKIRAKYGE